MNRYAVWGNPIHQSKSPRIHQLFAEKLRKEISYEAKLGDETLFEQQINDFFNTGAIGANITAPFKELAFQLADEHSENCKQAGACNTLKRLSDGRLYADNTDGIGLVTDLKRLNWLDKNQRILILGAGGATKGVLYPLLQAQQKITLYNRTIEKAVSLAQYFAKHGEIQTACLEQLSDQKFDLIINATSLGLQGKYVELPSTLLHQAKIYDMQYAPHKNTPFINFAKQHSIADYQDGLGMLVSQAAYSFELWEDILPDISNTLEIIENEMNQTN